MIPLESAMREKCGKKCRKNGNYHMEGKHWRLVFIVVNHCKVDLCMMHTLLKEKG